MSHSIPARNRECEMRGRGALRIARVAGQSAVVRAWSASPLKILVPRPRGPGVSAYLSSYGGGLVAGDEIQVDIEVADGARCYLSTQASTKIYRNPDSRPCAQYFNASVGREAVLVVAPDPVSAFGGSSYRQRFQFQIEHDSGLAVVDWLSSGRSARGERWAFTRYESRIEVFMDGRRRVLDSLLLDAADGVLDSASRMGRFNCLATVMLLGDALAGPAAQILEAISRRAVARRPELVCGASPVAGGVLVRLAGEHVEQVGREIYGLLDFLPQVLHDDPRLRKW